MNDINLLLLGMLYIFITLVYIFFEVKDLKKYKTFRIITFVRSMYTLVYGIVPSLIYLKYYLFNISFYNIDFSNQGIESSFTLYFLSIIGYFMINLGYRMSLRNKTIKHQENNKKFKEIKNLQLSAITIFAFGLIALYFWTKPYGSLFGIINQASAIRAGRNLISNKLAFMKELCPLLMFATYIIVAILLKNKKNIKNFVFLGFSSFFSIVYMLSNDGRMTFIGFFIIIIMGIILYKNALNKSNIDKYIFKIIIIGIVGFYIMSISGDVMELIRTGEMVKIESETKTKITDRVVQEVGYTIKSGQLALESYYNGYSGDRILIDIANGLLACIPSRFIPINYTLMTLYEYNTMLAGSRYTLPTDFISMCIYDLGYLGIIIIPLIFGLILRKIENLLKNKKNNTYYSMIYAILAFNLSQIIAYADLDVISRGFFYIVLGHLIVITLSKIKIKRVVF